MPKQIRFRRGTTAQHSAFTGADGELTADTDKRILVLHDGVTAGGKPLDAVMKDVGDPSTTQQINTIVAITGGDGSEIALDVTSSPAQFRAGVLALGYLLADKLIISKTVLPYAATVNLNFGRSFQTVALTGNVVFTTAGLTDGLHAFIKVTSDATLRTLTFPAGWKFVAARPRPTSPRTKPPSWNSGAPATPTPTSRPAGPFSLNCWESQQSSFPKKGKPSPLRGIVRVLVGVKRLKHWPHFPAITTRKHPLTTFLAFDILPAMSSWIQRFLLYEKENFALAKDRSDLAIYFLGLTPIVAGWVLSNTHPALGPAVTKAGFLLFAIWFFLLLPFRRHEQLQTAHTAELQHLRNKYKLPDFERQGLAMFLNEGSQLQWRCQSNYEPPSDATKDWYKRTEAFVATLGDIYLARFRAEVGIEIKTRPTGIPSTKHLQIWEFLYLKCYRLHEFLNEHA